MYHSRRIDALDSVYRVTLSVVRKDNGTGCLSPRITVMGVLSLYLRIGYVFFLNFFERDSRRTWL
jgi:hypothetical protein